MDRMQIEGVATLGKFMRGRTQVGTEAEIVTEPAFHNLTRSRVRGLHDLLGSVLLGTTAAETRS